MSESDNQSEENSVKSSFSLDSRQWTEILVVLVILGTLGFVAVKAIDNGENIASNNANFANLLARIDRISIALPDIQVKIAKEEIMGSISFAVVAVEPTSISEKYAVRVVHLVDIRNQEVESFNIEVLTEQDQKFDFFLLGVSASFDLPHTSFAKLESYSTNEGFSWVAPSFIDKKLSFVYRTDTMADYRNALLELGEEERSFTITNTLALPKNNYTWETFSAELNASDWAWRVGANVTPPDG